MTKTDSISDDKEENIVKKFGNTMLILCLYVVLSIVQAFWGLFCNYLIHNQREVFNKITPIDIVIGWGSCIVNQMILAMFLFCSLLPMVEFPWSAKKHREQGGKFINYSRVCILLTASVPLFFSYVCIYMVEIKIMSVENPPNFWTSAGALYGLSGYVKALPFCILFGYSEFKENREHKEQREHKGQRGICKGKVYAEETISSNQISNKGYMEVNSPRATQTREATQTRQTTQTDTEESRYNVV